MIALMMWNCFVLFVNYQSEMSERRSNNAHTDMAILCHGDLFSFLQEIRFNLDLSTIEANKILKLIKYSFVVNIDAV